MDRSVTFSRDDAVRTRILITSARLFSEYGLYGVSLDDISRELRVDTSFVAGYFNTPAEIHDLIIEGFFEELSGILISFAKSIVMPMQEKGQLDVLPDMLRFADQLSVDVFVDGVRRYLFALIDFFMENRMSLRIVLCSSTMKGKHNSCANRLRALFIPDKKNGIVADMGCLRNQFVLSDGAKSAYTRTVVDPLLCYAMFYDDTNGVLQKDREAAMRKELIHNIESNVYAHLQENHLVFEAR